MPDGTGPLASGPKTRRFSASPTGKGVCATARLGVASPAFFRNGDSPGDLLLILIQQLWYNTLPIRQIITLQGEKNAMKLRIDIALETRQVTTACWERHNFEKKGD